MRSVEKLGYPEAFFSVYAVPPPLARKLAGAAPHGHAARADLFARARAACPEFPVLQQGDRVDEKSYYMSDAWAAGLYAARMRRVEELEKDAELVARLRAEVLEARPVRKLQEALNGAGGANRATREMQEVIQAQVRSLFPVSYVPVWPFNEHPTSSIYSYPEIWG